MSKGRFKCLLAEFDPPMLNDGTEKKSPPKVPYQLINPVKISFSPSNSILKGGPEMVPGIKQAPDERFSDLAIKVFNENEKEELLRELLSVAIQSVRSGDLEALRRVLLAWEYTALWKKEPHILKELESGAGDSQNGVDWRDFLASEGL